ncbi:hypothetical protein BT96DRAFT_1061358 [Gymnopus androsaceus JB14]|uniref:Uncharacterized protein n=1 Tax=Gymnopus androsaceus JB14 TaxID=1447944 RepID=A0A6A4I538_9AGAR|nr:hypothetical protein BT96DRAFT_1061358 [Gymnopus androsaceus JB14]
MEPAIIITRGDPWFEDGNIILVPREESEPSEPDDSKSNPVGFRVHRGVYSDAVLVLYIFIESSCCRNHCQGMFEIPQPDAIYDNEVSRIRRVSGFIHALYDGATFNNRNVDDFFYLAGILRLSTKYFITHLRSQAIKYLTRTWSYDLQGHDTMLDLAVRTPILSYSPSPEAPPSGLSYPYIHPMHVLNLARSTNVRIVIPSAMYFLSLYPLDDLIRGDHPKLQVTHPSKPSSALQSPDLVHYTLMFQKRIDGGRTSPPACMNKNGKTCTRNFQRLRARLGTQWVVRTGPFNFIAQAITQVNQDPESFCGVCGQEFASDAGKYREKFWAELPGLCGLPGWDIMKEEELT